MTPPFILELIRPFRRQAAVVGVLVVLDMVLMTLGVGAVLPVFQALLDPEHQTSLFRFVPALDALDASTRLVVLAGATILLFLLKTVVAYYAAYTTHEFVHRVRFYWVGRIGQYYLYGPHLRVVSRKQGELLNDWFNETYAAARYLQAYTALFSSAVLTVALFGLSLVISWKATLIMFVAGLTLVLLIQRRLFVGAAKLSGAKILATQGITTSMVENLTNIREIKFMQAELARLDGLEQQTKVLRRILLRSSMLAELPRITGEFLVMFLLMSFLAIATLTTNWQPQTLVPMLAFVFILFYRLFTAGTQWTSARTRGLNEIHSARLVHELAAQTVEFEDRERGAPIERIGTDIRFEGLRFAYEPGRSALADIDAVIPRGRRTFLLGPSGAGKSTLLDLLLRLVEPDAGRVVANGRAAAEFNVSQWRRCFGYVSQDAALFNGSIRMNLLLARPAATGEEMAEACRLAGAADFIVQLPDGYDTAVGDRGQSLSGGQRKRIAIARALINKPSVLILDEATSAFEQNLEADILSSLGREMPDLTIVQVTHRPQAVGEGDWVVALEEGRVVATGSPVDVRAEAAVPLV
jgi:ABC-type multidrug transport system fused ATPase/permease subunit